MMPGGTVPLAPPTVPGPVTLPRRPIVWPEWLGTVMLALGTVTVLYSLAMLLLGPVLRAYAPQMVESWSHFDGVKDYAALAMVDQTIKGVMGAYALYVGYLLLKRRPECAKHAKRWALARLALFLPTIGLFGWVQYVQTGWMQDKGMVFQSSAWNLWAGIGINLTIYSCYLLTPAVFLIIWFRVRSVRERVSHWEATRSKA